MAPKFQRNTRAQVQAANPAREESAETDKLFGLSGTLPRLIEADVERITPNPDQPRTVFDDAALQSLAASIEKHGLQQPVLVKPAGTPGSYMLVAGERRLRAHQLLGRKTIPAIITQGRSEEIALIENVQRVDLDAVDLARSVQRLIDQHGYLMAEAGALLGCTEAEVSRRVSVLRLPNEILDEYRQDPSRVSRSVLVELATLDDPEQVRSLWDRARTGITVRDVRAEKKATKTGAPSATERALSDRSIGKSLTKMAGDLERLHDARPVLADEHRTHLMVMRDRINALLGE